MRVAAVALALVAACCSSARPPAPVVERFGPRLAEARHLLEVGCFTCLVDALQIYESILTRSTSSRDAADGAVHAALLLDFRQRELGMADEDYRARAEAVLTAHGLDRQRFALWLDTLDLLAWPYPRPDDDAAVSAAASVRQVAVRRNLDAEMTARRARADEDALSAHAWIAFVCAYSPQAGSDAAREPLAATSGFPIVAYSIAVCGRPDVEALRALRERDSRFIEIDYWLGRAALSATDLERAEEHLTRAYQAHRAWPALTVTLGHVSMAFEDMERARDLYEETLVLAPQYPDALVGHVRALGYLGRHQDALDALDRITKSKARVFAGELFYWRAWNLAALDRLDEAWDDVERARALWVNNDVAKLAGLIAYRRRQLDVSYARFAEARKIDPTDCEVLYNLGQIDSEERRWIAAVNSLPSATACLERTREAIADEITRLRAAQTEQVARLARQIANRENRIAAATRMLETAWFNLALSHFSLSQASDARLYAQRLADHPQFGARAREILLRLPQ